METCPQCGSKKVKAISRVLLGVIIACVGTIIFLIPGFWFPLAWAGIPVCWLAGYVMIIGGSVYQCRECGHTWPIITKRGRRPA